MTTYTEEFKTRIIEDYADQTKTCWASDSGKPVSECWCAQCNEARTLRPLFIELKQAHVDAIHHSSELAITRAERESAKARFIKISEFIQASIDRDEWTEDELAEPFWTELAELVGVDLKQTEEIEVTFTATYSAWVTVPKNTDITELEIDLAWHPDVTLDGDGVGSANQDNVEVDPA
jgi:hypothetical protein